MFKLANPVENILNSLSADDHIYQLDEESRRYFLVLAERIAYDLRPASVLALGSLTHYLVQALRHLGIECLGQATSESILQSLPADVQPFYWIGSPLKPFQKRVNLIICLEALNKLSLPDTEPAIQNICQHCDDVLFSSLPFYHPLFLNLDIQPFDYWAKLFAQNGFIRDLNYDAGYLTPWAVRFHRATFPLEQVVSMYEHRLWVLEQENRVRRELQIEQRNDLAQKDFKLAHVKDQLIQDLQRQVADKEFAIQEILNSRSWRIMQKFQNVRLRLIPLGSRREEYLLGFFRGLRLLQREGFVVFSQRVFEKLSWSTKIMLLRIRHRGHLTKGVIQIDGIKTASPVQPHQATIDIIVCVHNALEDVQRCLKSVVQGSTMPFSLILIDDGSDPLTRDFLVDFSQTNECVLIRNEGAKGYTRAANQGLQRSSADYVILLNSDTIVTSGWLDRLVACTESDPKIGVVGPLSNTASWQSIPEIESNGDWANNPLPEGISIEKMGDLVSAYSGRNYPIVPFLNGFCLGIRRAVIEEIGIFDEENFGQGYGEENDYCLRAYKAGWKLAIADDVYIFHAQSRSYSNERRKHLSEQAGARLAEKHGQRIIDQGVEYCIRNRVLEGIRARSRAMFERWEIIERGQTIFKGRKILFILPIQVPGGGGNVVISEARAMQKMGVEVRIFNLKGHQVPFERAYPNLDIQVVYGEVEELPFIARAYDAVIATFNPSVGWVAPTFAGDFHPMFGYYIQDFEPYFYPPDSEGYRRARDSYKLIPNMVRFAKTDWTSQEVNKQLSVDCAVVGCSFDIDLFQPRPRKNLDWPDRPLRIAAMIRPSSPYRQPRATMETLKQVSQRFGTSVEIILFGTQPNDPGFVALPRDFPWSLAGILTPKQLANLMNEVDIFVDFSTYQAMGLTALEAMACGVATIVPVRGGANAFAKDHENSLVIDTSSKEIRFEALKILIQDHLLRSELQNKAIQAAVEFCPEKPALNILSLLF